MDFTPEIRAARRSIFFLGIFSFFSLPAIAMFVARQYYSSRPKLAAVLITLSGGVVYLFIVIDLIERANSETFDIGWFAGAVMLCSMLYLLSASFILADGFTDKKATPLTKSEKTTSKGDKKQD